jgi:hypothetical protein
MESEPMAETTRARPSGFLRMGTFIPCSYLTNRNR